jgi:hypothetical protein
MRLRGLRLKTGARLSLLLLCLPLLVAQDSHQVGSVTIAGEDQFKEPEVLEVRRKQIRRELGGALVPEWAGEYYYGDGLGTNVSVQLAPRTGFVFTWYGCMGLYAKNYGAVESRNGLVVLRPELPNKREAYAGTATEFLPVRWGERHYLIAADQMIDFANQYNAGFEPRASVYGMHLLRRGDDQKPATGKPPLPFEYRGYLLDRPIEAHVTAVGELHKRDEYISTATIVLSAGQDAGLKPGMRLYVVDAEHRGATVRVTRVGNASSEAEASLFGSERLERGWKMSTRVMP